MYGAVPPPAARRRGGVLVVRVLLTACPPLTFGLLSFVPLLRIALLRRRWYDWTLAGAAFPVTCALFAIVGSLPEDAAGTDISLCALLIAGVMAGVYFLVFDLHRQERLALVPPPHYGHLPPYGYPPYNTAPMAPAPPLPAPGAVRYAQQPQQPGPVPGPRPAAAPGFGHPVPPVPVHTPRIAQVRAELDELSDLLRKDSGSGGGDGDRRGGTGADGRADRDQGTR